ncbi:MAG: signal peptide peptidase SppA [Phycisphaerales bacterium]
MDTISPAKHLGFAAGGIARAIGFAAGMLVLAIVFVVGMGIGAATMFAGTLAESPVIGESYRDGNSDTIAVIPVEGIIDSYQASRVRLLVDEVLADDSVLAVVLRVDSPGGGIAASDRIWYEVRRLRESGLPVVSSYGGVAASGGYYISCATDHILAEPTCITGSIGVIAQSFIFKDLLDKVGVEPVTLISTASPSKDMGNPYRAWTEDDRVKYVALLDAAYDIFNQRVREGRSHTITDPARIDELADGSIYTAAQALSSGLIDSIGYLDDAVTEAEKRAGVTPGESSVIILRQATSIFDDLLISSPASIRSRLRDAESIRSLVNELAAPRLMYLMR